ncbi:MAG TPA: sugar ABC transporter substrate-binding protein [Solirubrobacteraceae bacterium]|nr:sugar ABC transporter substrate-binding protein [Solirubrobacteraceae bacterium]
MTARRVAAALAALVLAALATGCGSTERVRERDLVASGGSATTPSSPRTGASGSVRIAVVTHGQASSVYWATVRNGIDAAARETGVVVRYRSPDVFSVRRMSELIDEAVATRPDALVVTLPDRSVEAAVRRAERAGIPVVSINSGDDLFRSAGVLAHVGQDEDAAGYEAGRRLIAAGVTHAVCLNLEHGNGALDRRCAGFARALRSGGATSRDLALNLDDQARAERLLAGVFRSTRIDGALALSSSGAEAALAALRDDGRVGKVVLGSFDLSPAVLEAVRDGRVAFTIDQQPYLQGYLPIVVLANYVRYGLVPEEGRLIRTGPHFVTAGDAEQALELSRRRIR